MLHVLRVNRHLPENPVIHLKSDDPVSKNRTFAKNTDGLDVYHVRVLSVTQVTALSEPSVHCFVSASKSICTDLMKDIKFACLRWTNVVVVTVFRVTSLINCTPM